MKKDLEPQTLPTATRINIKLLKNDLDKIRNIKSYVNRKNINNIYLELIGLKSKISSDQKLEETLNRTKLTRLGLDLLGTDGSCPLCDTAWKSKS